MPCCSPDRPCRPFCLLLIVSLISSMRFFCACIPSFSLEVWALTSLSSGLGSIFTLGRGGALAASLVSGCRAEGSSATSVSAIDAVNFCRSSQAGNTKGGFCLGSIWVCTAAQIPHLCKGRSADRTYARFLSLKLLPRYAQAHANCNATWLPRDLKGPPISGPTEGRLAAIC